MIDFVIHLHFFMIPDAEAPDFAPSDILQALVNKYIKNLLNSRYFPALKLGTKIYADLIDCSSR